MTTPTDAERALFEATYTHRSPGFDRARMPSGAYRNRYVEHSWDGWQAARIQPAQVLAQDAADGRRLDWLQQRGATVSIILRRTVDGDSYRFQIGGLHSAVDTDIRKAIDAAITLKQQEPS